MSAKTDETLDSLKTLSLLEDVQYDSVFSFKYSPRAGTAAIQYEDEVPEEEKSRRLTILQEMQRRIQQRNNERHIDTEKEVLVEGRRTKFDQWVGRTTQNRVLNFTTKPDDTEDLLGSYCRVRVTATGANSLTGEIIERCAPTPANQLRILQ